MQSKDVIMVHTNHGNGCTRRLVSAIEKTATIRPTTSHSQLKTFASVGDIYKSRLQAFNAKMHPIWCEDASCTDAPIVCAKPLHMSVLVRGTRP